jgi:hypothetical protein
MIFRFSGLCAALLLTAGCSSLHNFLGSDPDSGPPAMAETAAPAPPPAQPADWCNRVAANARAQAAADGFDQATQERLTQQSLRQCATMDSH